MVYAGVDVGGRRSGFHVAAVDGRRLLARPTRLLGAEDVVDWLRPFTPMVVGVDSPRRPAPDGQRSRESERLLARAFRSVRYTPDCAALDGNPSYYDRVERGFELYDALRRARLVAVECFPTATWTRWLGPRRGESRARWSRRGVESLGLVDLPAVLGLGDCDAIGAAMTAYAYDTGRCETFGEIAVPYPGTPSGITERR